MQFRKLTIAIVAGLSSSYAVASGYHFGTQSVSAQSTANASAAEAADASTLYYNAAGLTKLEGTNISINANIVGPSVHYKNASASYPIEHPGQTQESVTGISSGKITDNIVIAPHVYASHQINDKLTVGLGTYIPFASSTEYQRNSVLRYNINKTGLTSIDINPTLSYKINDNHSISAGLVAQYTTAKLRQYANLGALARAGNGIDSYGEVEGDDWGVGYTLSYLWDVNDKLRLGTNYRSKVEHKLKGSAKWIPENAAYELDPRLLAIARAAGYKASEDVSVKIITPESLSVHGMYKVTPKWTAFGDVTWTRHSRFNSLNIKYENPKAVANVERKSRGCFPNSKCQLSTSKTTALQPNWRDTYKIGIGAAYQYSEPLELRFGVAYDQSPVKNANYRLSTMPDNNRIWFSVGAKYDFNENSSLNLGYSYIHIKNGKANVNGWCGSLNPSAKNCVSSRTNGSADYTSHAHILGIQYNYRF